MKKLYRLILATLATGTLLAPGTAAASPPGPAEARPLIFKSETTSNCLARDVNNNAVTALCNQDETQQWFADEANDAGLFYLRNGDSALCLHKDMSLGSCEGYDSHWFLSSGPVQGRGYIIAADLSGIVKNASGPNVYLGGTGYDAGAIWQQIRPS
ncbi:hypothetical protein [Streptomyces sp. NPDC002403]